MFPCYLYKGEQLSRLLVCFSSHNGMFSTERIFYRALDKTEYFPERVDLHCGDKLKMAELLFLKVYPFTNAKLCGTFLEFYSHKRLVSRTSQGHVNATVSNNVVPSINV